MLWNVQAMTVKISFEFEKILKETCPEGDFKVQLLIKTVDIICPQMKKSERKFDYLSNFTF